MAFCKPVDWTELALDDLNNIVNYLQVNWNSAVIENFIQLTERTLEFISCYPKMYRMVNKGKRVRRCVLTSQNSLYYRVFKGRIQVIRIYDNRRKPISIS